MRGCINITCPMIQKILYHYGGPFAVIMITAFIWFSWFDILQVQEISMEPVLHNGQTIIVNKMAYKGPFSDPRLPNVNDIVIFRSPGDRRLVVKRCKMLPGDNIQINNQGWLVVQGEEFFLTDSQKERLTTTPVIPDGYIMVLGDNPFHSIDSRDYGFVPIDTLVGKVINPAGRIVH